MTKLTGQKHRHITTCRPPNMLNAQALFIVFRLTCIIVQPVAAGGLTPYTGQVVHRQHANSFDSV